MKKILFATSLLAVCLMMSPMAFAGASTQDLNTSVTVTITDATTGDFTYDASPNVSVLAVTTDTDYAITTANRLTDTENGMEYGTLSTATGYAQRAKTTAAGVLQPAPPDSLSLPTGTWIWQGGDGDAT